MTTTTTTRARDLATAVSLASQSLEAALMEMDADARANYAEGYQEWISDPTLADFRRQVELLAERSRELTNRYEREAVRSEW
jgi:hypothetical protein